MSTKHYFPETAANTLVPRALRALVTSNPHLVLDEANRVVANSRQDASSVSIVSGGGSGHEPAWSGFVGDNLLSAAACGDIFASPSTKQVLAAMKLAPSNKGTILLITNYTGDRLHFGLAAERARASGLGKNVCVLAATDDVSIGRSKCSRVGRRGLPGHIVTMKILSSAAAQGWEFERCVTLGRALNDQTVSIGSSLDHCHVPGRQHQSLSADSCVVGAGIHNEPGQQVLSPMPPVQDVIKRCLALLCDPTDTERAFVQFESHDKVVMLINNYGGLSTLELGALTDEVQAQLGATYNIKPCRTMVGTFETSLNAPGFSISLCNISAVERQCNETTEELLRLFHLPTTAVSWPNVASQDATANGLAEGVEETSNQAESVSGSDTSVVVDASLLEHAVRQGCRAAIASEPQLTKWDMIMGDGDCGEAVKTLCESVLAGLDAGWASSGSILSFLGALNAAVDDMGGTLGAILGILLSAFQSAIQSRAPDHSPQDPTLYASALVSALDVLLSYTPAREGDRTVMDVLMPFATAFAESKSLSRAVTVAKERAESTALLKPRLGRASYVGEAASQEVPDPGAWAFYEMMHGLSVGLGLQASADS